MLRLRSWKRNGGLGSADKHLGFHILFRSSGDLEKVTIASKEIRRSLLNSVS